MILEDIELAASEIPGLQVQTAAEAAIWIEEFKGRFVADPAATWWWTALRPEVETESFAYADSGPWQLLQSRSPARDRYSLLVTDEAPEPLGLALGSLAALRRLVDSVHFFEYVISNSECSFAMFDTHGNVLIDARTMGAR